jgi:hypothetical protein
MTIQTYAFNRFELATLLIKQQGIHEGQWSLEIRVECEVTNMSKNSGASYPSILLQVSNYLLQRHETAQPFTVDAAVVNPAVEEFPSEITVA